MSAADILPGHRGTCHRALDFSDDMYQEVAGRVERDYERRFLEHRAVLRIVPIAIHFRKKPSQADLRGRSGRFSRRLNYVGEGVAVRVDPVVGAPDGAGQWWSEAEADMIVRQRLASEDGWTVLYTPNEVDRLLREQVESYLRQFVRSESGPVADRAGRPRSFG